MNIAARVGNNIQVVNQFVFVFTVVTERAGAHAAVPALRSEV